MHLSRKLYLTTGNLSKSLHKESMSTIEGQRNAQTLETLKNIDIDETFNLFNECFS